MLNDEDKNKSNLPIKCRGAHNNDNNLFNKLIT